MYVRMYVSVTLRATEYIVRIRSGPFEREDGAPVHLATTEARFMPD